MGFLFSIREQFPPLFYVDNCGLSGDGANARHRQEFGGLFKRCVVGNARICYHASIALFLLSALNMNTSETWIGCQQYRSLPKTFVAKAALRVAVK